MKSCLICDDHALVREALVGMVRLGWPDTAIVQAGDYPTAHAAAAAGVDFCIADLVMPGAYPLEGVKGLRAAAPDMPVLVVTGTEDDALMMALLDVGVAGFAPKTASGSVIEAAIRLILAGGRYLPARLADIAAAGLGQPSAAASPLLPTESERLTERQIAVLRLVANGLSNKEIARTLELSPATIKTHLEHALSSLGAGNRTEASVKARALGLI